MICDDKNFNSIFHEVYRRYETSPSMAEHEVGWLRR